MSFCEKLEHFCFICGQFTAKRNKRSKTDNFKVWFRSYYEREWIDEYYAPQFGCSSCYTGLYRWSKQKKDQPNMSALKPKYKEPMTWINPGNHDRIECYSCVNYVLGLNTLKKRSIPYTATINTALPVLHNKESPPLNMPVAAEKQSDATGDDDDLAMAMEMDVETEDFSQPGASSEYVPPRSINMNPILVNDQYLNHMARKLNLDQRKTAILASLLKNNNLLDAGVTISSQKSGRQSLYRFSHVKTV